MQTSENDDPLPQHYGVTTKLLRYIAAALCGFSLVGLGGLLTGVEVGGIGKDWSPFVDSPEAELFGRLFTAFSLAAFFAMTFGVAFGRFLLRAFPPAIAGQGGRSQAWKVIPCAIVFIGLYIVGMGLGVSGAAANDPSAWLGLAWSPLFVVILAIASLGLFVSQYRQRQALLDQPFVLVLRRFSSFSDRAVVALILGQVPYKLRVVFLTPTLSRRGDWDPFVVGFAGLKMRHPWRSAPIVTRARDETWQDAAEGLIRRARLILLDVSETSGAVRAEVEMIDKADRWRETVCLRLAVSGETPVADFSGARTIDYTKSWLRALPRMALGSVFSFVAAEFPVVAAWALGGPLLTLMTIALFAWLYYSVFVRPAVNKKAKVELRKVLGQPLC